MSSAKTWRRETIETAGDVALERVGGYLRGTAVIAAVDGFFEALFLFLLGVPNAPALGVHRLLRPVHPVHRRAGDDDHPAVRDAVQRRPDGSHRPARPDHHPERHPGQVPGPDRVPPDRPHPPGARADRAAGRRGPGRHHRPVRGDPGRRIRARDRRCPRVGPRRRADTQAIVDQPDGARSGSTDSASGAGACSCRSACSASSSPRSSRCRSSSSRWSSRVVLAATLAPLAEALERRGWSHGRAAIGATLGAAVGIIVIVGLTLVSLAPPISDMIDSAVAGSSSADSSTGGQAGDPGDARPDVRDRDPGHDRRGAVDAWRGSP